MNDLHSLTGAYALDALNADERARFERHLHDCADCAREVGSFVETADLLGLAAATAPPPALRTSILDAISHTRQLPPLPQPADSRPADPQPAGSGDAEPVAPIQLSAERTRRSGRRGAALLAAAAAVVAIGVGVGVGVIQPWQSEQSPSDTPSLSATQQVLDASDAERVRLELGEATATVVRSKSLGRAVIVTEEMPPAPDGDEYVLWLQSPEGEMVQAGVMPPGGSQTVPLKGDASRATAVGITAEPAGSDPSAPSTDPLAVFELT